MYVTDLFGLSRGCSPARPCRPAPGWGFPGAGLAGNRAGKVRASGARCRAGKRQPGPKGSGRWCTWGLHPFLQKIKIKYAILLWIKTDIRVMVDLATSYGQVVFGVEVSRVDEREGAVVAGIESWARRGGWTHTPGRRSSRRARRRRLRLRGPEVRQHLQARHPETRNYKKK